MTTKDEVRSTVEALKMALEALEYIDRQDNDRDFLSPAECGDLDCAITAIREALAREANHAPTEREQPAQQEPLTDEEIKRLKPISADFVSFRAGVRCVEREYGIGAKR